MAIQGQARGAGLLVGVAPLALWAGMVATAQAQEAKPSKADATVDQVVVVGFRKSLTESIALKKNAQNIVEVISAEDIGKLPDVSIAESLARMPGLSMQRVDGRAQNLSLRGLGPDYSNTLLNGREQVSTGDNRSVEFDQYPSELLNQVVVYKTPDAGLIGAGLAGTVDLRTVKPLAYGHRALAIGARYEVNDLGALNAGSTDHGNRVSLSYIDQFADKSVGIALGYAHMESPYQAEKFNSWGYPNVSSGGAYVIGGIKPYAESSKITRDSFMGVFEYRPTTQFSTTIDAYYSTFDNRQMMRGIELPLFWSSASLQPGYQVGGGFVTSGTFNGVKGVIRNDEKRRNAKLWAVGWNSKYNFSNGWTAELDLAHSENNRTDDLLETYSGTGRSGFGSTDNIGFVFNNKGATLNSTLDYTNPSLIYLTSSNGWGAGTVPGISGGQDGYYNRPHINDKLDTVRLNLKRDMGWLVFNSVEFGAYYSQRKKTLLEDEWFVAVKGNPANMPIPSNLILGVTSLGFLGIKGILSYDPFAMINSGAYNLIRNPNADVLTKSWGVEEKVWTGYAKLGINTEVNTIPLTGNLGLQVVNSDQSSDGFAASGTGAGVVAKPVKGSANYTEVLPSVNLTFTFPDNQLVRVAAARTLSRARMDQMRASREFSYNAALWNSTDPGNSPWGGKGGDPKLKPWLADAVDISYERYFDRLSYISIAAYYKHLENNIYERNVVTDFTGYPYGGTNPPALNVGAMKIWSNGEGGYIYGVEFTAATPFKTFHPWLDGFGGIISVASNRSSVQTSDTVPLKSDLPGLSKTTATATLYYEKNGISARISDRYRSDFLGEIPGFGNARTFRMVRAEQVVDAQIGYSFETGPLKGLSLTAQVNNLTNEPFRTYQNGDKRQIIDYENYGRTYMIGVNYKM